MPETTRAADSRQPSLQGTFTGAAGSGIRSCLGFVKQKADRAAAEPGTLRADRVGAEWQERCPAVGPDPIWYQALLATKGSRLLRSCIGNRGQCWLVLGGPPCIWLAQETLAPVPIQFRMAARRFHNWVDLASEAVVVRAGVSSPGPGLQGLGQFLTFGLLDGMAARTCSDDSPFKHRNPDAA